MKDLGRTEGELWRFVAMSVALLAFVAIAARVL